MDNISKNPAMQLNQAASTKKPLSKELMKTGKGVEKSIVDAYKTESYEYKTPGFLKLGIFAKTLNPAEAMERLKEGKDVVVKEDVEVKGTYDDNRKWGDRSIHKKTLKTTLHSMDDFKAFADTEANSAKVEKGNLSKMLEQFEFKAAGPSSFFEIVDKKGKAISSTEAAKKIENNETIQIRERQFEGKAKKAGQEYYDDYESARRNALPGDKIGTGISYDCYTYSGTRYYVVKKYTTEIKSPVAKETTIPFDSAKSIEGFYEQHF